MAKRDERIDILRAIAMVLVVVVHVANYYCRAYTDCQVGDFCLLGALFYNAAARVSVPVFFMISGALLLSRPYNREKNLSRIHTRGVSLLAFTVIYLLWDFLFMKKTNINLFDIISEPERSLLWYLYAVIAIYIALPFIKRMVEGMTEREDKLFITLWVAVSVTKSILSVLDSPVKYPVPIIGGIYYSGYFVIGYLIFKHAQKIAAKINKPLLLVIAALSFAFTVIASYVISVKKGEYDKLFLNYSSAACIIMSLCLYLVLYFSLPNKKYKVLGFLAEHSLAVYLVHGIMLDIVMRFLPFARINAFAGVPIFSAAVLVFTLPTVYGLRKISFIKRYI